MFSFSLFRCFFYVDVINFSNLIRLEDPYMSINFLPVYNLINKLDDWRKMREREENGFIEWIEKGKYVSSDSKWNEIL